MAARCPPLRAAALTTSPDRRPLARWIAAGLGSGRMPRAPGTWGSAAALLPGWWLWQTVGGAGLLAAAALITALGCLVCARVLPAEEGEEDPGWIVIDEWAGQWLALALPAFGGPPSLPLLLTAFSAFRLFDILKPWPIQPIEHLGPDWWAIMADDLAAGLLAGMVAALSAGFPPLAG
ncbi:MAG: phosphatidylglycerophosphatase A [Zetaproteobacteria bacterium]|nr:MAG: phosphatidylglycerophosphatase A [Zetaproteobacteria bacterium]